MAQSAAVMSISGRTGSRPTATISAIAPIIGCEHDAYDEVLAVWYPSRSAFLRLTDYPGYEDALAHRDAALERAAVLPCAGSADKVLRGPFG